MNGNSSVSFGEGNPDSESYDKSGQTILEELSLSTNDITKQEVIDYAQTIGINPSTEPHLLWIARKGLLASLPASWIPVQDQLGRIYFHNKVTGNSTWTHPVDRFLQSFVKKRRAEHHLKSAMAADEKVNPLANLHFLDVDEEDDGDGGLQSANSHGKSIGKSKNGEIKMGQSVIGDGKPISKNVKLSNGEKGRNAAIIDQKLTLSSFDESIEGEMDSIQFDLDEDAFKDMEDDDKSLEEEVTLDITEGGPCDVKNYHEIYQVDLLTVNDDGDENDDGRKNREVEQGKTKESQGEAKSVKIVRPKSGRPGSRSIKPSLEVLNDDLDKYIDADVDGDDDFSLQSIEIDPFASEGVGMFQVPRQELIAIPSFPLNQLETLKEEPDEDARNEEDTENEGEEEDEDEFEEDESMNGDKQTSEDGADGRQKNTLIDLIGQQTQFKRLSDQLRKDIFKLRDELFTVINRKSDDMAKKTVEKWAGVERRLSETEGNIVSLKSEQRKYKMESSTESSNVHQGVDCVVEISKIRREVNSLSEKADKSVDDCKELLNKETHHVKKSLDSIRDEFQITMDQFRDFKKDNDLAIRALRKQLTEVSTSQDNLESLTSKTQSDLHRLSREVNGIRREDDDDQETLRSEIKQLMLKERGEHDKLTSSIDDIRETVRKEISLMEQSMKKRDQQFELSQATVNDEMNQTKSVLHYLTKELDTIKQSIEERKSESKEKETISSDVALEERLNQIETNLSTINGKLEALRVARERERKMRTKFDNYYNANVKRGKKIPSSCSSYEDTLSSSSEEIKKNQDKPKKRRDHHYHYRNSAGTSSQHRSKADFEPSLSGKHRDYIKYSPLHFSPILITSQPMERSHHHVKSSSSSLLAMIKRTSRLLQDEASDLDGLGNYRFVSDMSNGLISRSNLDADESAIRKLKQIRCDVDEKLKRLNAMVRSNAGDNSSTVNK